MTDTLGTFVRALPWRARAALTIDHRVFACLRAAEDAGMDVTELAATVSRGTQRHANQGALLLYRLQRETGQLKDDQEDD